MNWKYVTAAVVLAAAGFAAWLGISGGVEKRTYRIGWQPDPPFQAADAEGRPGGLAIDLVREAARRRGIALEWVRSLHGAEELRTGALDLWPFITVRPERKGLFHITEPYLETQVCFLVRESSRHRTVADLAAASISLSDLPIDARAAHEIVPTARLFPRNRWNEILEDVCAERTDAAFLESYSAVASLLGGAACQGTPLRWIEVPQRRSRLGVGASFASRAAADAIRDEIGVMASEGRLGETLGRWGYMSGQHLERVEALLNARRREQRLTAGILFAVFLLLLTLWQTFRIRSAREELRQSEQKLRLTADNLKEMILAYDMRRRLIFANPAVETLTGYTAADLRSAGFINWIHPDDQPRVLPTWEKLFAGEGFADLEYRMTTRAGELKWVSATWGPLLDQAGRQIGVQGCERDITDRRLAEDALRESEGTFRRFLEGVKIAAVMYDVHGVFTFCNDYALAVTGYAREELVGKHAYQILAPEEHARVAAIIDSLAKGAALDWWYGQPTILTKDGKRRFMEVNNVVFRNAAGRITGVASLAVDVTENRALREQYLQAQKLESVGRLAGGVAHDFNNLLTVINGYSELAAEKLSATDPVRLHVEQIRKAGERAADLTQQLLTFSRKQIIQPRPLDLNAEVAESERMLQRLVGEDIELVTSLSPSLGLVMADPGQMHQILMNLAVNARDALPEGGRITIATENLGAGIQLSVSDTGTGMDEETRSHVFEPFFTTKSLGQGTGLGLSTVYGIVSQSQGQISVESEPGRGTTFRIYLPRADEAPAITEGSRAASRRRGSECVLLVEDDHDVRSLAKSVLVSQGYDVLEAASGPEALALLAQCAGGVDLLVTDVVMPGMNGRDLAARVQAMRPEIRVLFMSGYTDDVIARRGVLEPGLAYLAKPFGPDSLGAKVRQVLDTESP